VLPGPVEQARFEKLDRILSGSLLSPKGSGELERRLRLAGGGGLETRVMSTGLWDLGFDQ